MTAEEVMGLQIGETVELIGSGQSVTCTVAAHGGEKFLTWRDKGQLKRLAIRDYPGTYFTPRPIFEERRNGNA